MENEYDKYLGTEGVHCGQICLVFENCINRFIFHVSKRNNIINPNRPYTNEPGVVCVVISCSQGRSHGEIDRGAHPKELTNFPMIIW